MKLTRVWISAAAFAVAFGAAASAWPQSMSESDTTTTTTAPPPPSVTSETVTHKVVNPPAVVVNPPSETETTTTENTVPDRPAPSVEEKKESNTSFGPLGVSHSEKHEKTSDY